MGRDFRDGIVNTALVFVSARTLMRDVLREMRERGVSSVLIEDESGQVVGIVTERDVVHRFSLLDVADKLDAPVNTVMSRPVRFARAESVFEDVARLHREAGLRHFPVLAGERAVRKNVVGMVTATDMLRSFLTLEETRRRQEAPVRAPQVVILGALGADVDGITKLLGGMGVAVRHEPTWRTFPDGEPRPILLFDLDGDGDAAAKAAMVKRLKDEKGHVILLTADPRLIPPFRKHLGEGKAIFLKPVDVSFIHWLVVHHWGAEKP